MTEKERKIKSKAYLQGYADGEKRTANTLLSTWYLILRNYDSVEAKKKSLRLIVLFADGYGVEVEDQ